LGAYYDTCILHIGGISALKTEVVFRFPVFLLLFFVLRQLQSKDTDSILELVDGN